MTTTSTNTPSLGQFKNVYCNENEIISQALNEELSDYLEEPFMDIGAGIGDISAAAFKHMTGYLVDISTPKLNSTNEYHTWIESDFFSLNEDIFKNPGTVLFSHSLQYLDDDIDRLKDKIQALNPYTIIDVVNDNSGKFGVIINQLINSDIDLDAETPIDYAPENYERVKEHKFSATLSCDSFEQLAHILIYHILGCQQQTLDLHPYTQVLSKNTLHPEIEIAQTIRVYQRRTNMHA